MSIHVVDDVLADPIAYRNAALARAFETVDVGQLFHGIALAGDTPVLPAWIHQQFGLETVLSFFRKSPEGQEEPNYIHTDVDMGEWTAILYLTLDPPEHDGTLFWRQKDGGAIATTSRTPVVLASWRDRSLWESWYHVQARFNRVVLFPATYYHSRAIAANYGQGHGARLIQVVFGLGQLPDQEKKIG